MIRMILTVLFVIPFSLGFAADYQLTSPDQNIEVEVQLQEKIYYSVLFKGERVMQFSPLTLNVDGNTLGENAEVQNAETRQVDESIETVWGRRSDIRDFYNELTLQCGAIFQSNSAPIITALPIGLSPI